LPLDEIARQIDIIWYFEHEAELIHLCQLISLLAKARRHITHVYIPYLPYGRQDKETSNESTFALRTFLALLPQWPIYVTLDIHSDVAIDLYSKHGFTPCVMSISPTQYIRTAIVRSEATVVVFPDEGARKRYLDDLYISEFVVLAKNRDQLTGRILSQTIDKSASNFSSLADKRLLIVDDICDGGRTFISAAQVLREFEQKITSIDLYVTHGIFSQGRECLHEGGIRNIYTTKSLLKNTDGFDLEEF
jgi:ribose-phosphate pyrophosphokinase